MTLAVPDHIGFCDIQGRTALLDIEHNRYFALPSSLEAAFRRFVAGRASAEELQRLRRRGIVAEGRRTRVLNIATPNSSHAEEYQVPKTRPGQVLRVGRRILAARHAVRRRRFANVAEGLDRQRVAFARCANPGLTIELREAVSDFLAARHFVPVAPVCLQDSLALLSYLAPLGFRPMLVFGVALDPFSAHCWVQAESVVLNDALHRARSHIPILAL